MVSHAQFAIIFNTLFIPRNRVAERHFSYLTLAFIQGYIDRVVMVFENSIEQHEMITDEHVMLLNAGEE